jgi:tRNA dimethylallyltransferase
LLNSISPLVVIAGPTASGKSALALELAQWLKRQETGWRGEIVNADSLQLYVGMDIGSAKVQLEERQGIPHHLFDVRNPNEVFTAGEYSRLGRKLLEEIRARHALPILVGGAGFYLKALFDGLAPAPTRDSAYREELNEMEAREAGALHRALALVDPEAAGRIHANDINKLIRALEVIHNTRKPLSEMQSAATEKLENFRALWIGLEPEREALRARIAERTEHMFAEGLVDEVVRLRALGYGPEAKAMESVGYKQVQAYLDGAMTLEEAKEDITLRTRQYAKRQLTWFRKETESRPIHWLKGFGHEAAIQAQAESLLKQFLSDPIENSFR